MHLLFETPLGYALFKVDEQTFTKAKTWKDLPSEPKQVKKVLQLQAFKEFTDAKEVLQASVKLIHGKLSKKLEKFLKTNLVSEAIKTKLLVVDKKLATEINKKLGITCEANDKVIELIRCVRGCMDELMGSVDQAEMKNMALGLAHGLGRFRIKFSSEKVDTMIIQAISLHADLDKEINNYMMRLREWYGYHFPELTKIVTDNAIYSKIVKALGMRKNAADKDLAAIVGEDIERDIRTAADVSMGTDISANDESFILGLADQVLELNEYRDSLEAYLVNRMAAVAPNLSALVGEMIAAKLIAKAGSLVNLAKHSASTLQIIGAEKALFKAMKAKKNTPKYGIIYQTKIVANANGKAKGKIARALAAKSSLCVRLDALQEEENTDLGQECKEYIDKRLEYLEKEETNGNTKPAQQKRFGKEFRQPAARGGYNDRADNFMQKRNFNDGNGHQANKRFKTN